MHNGNMKLEHFIDVGKSVPKNYLVERLNAVNKQGITDIDLNTRTYKKGNILVDEIDSYVHPADRHVVYSFLKDISKEVDVIAATHDIQLTSYGDKYYTVTSDMFVVDLQEITEEEYRNIV